MKAGARYFDERLRKGKLKAVRAEINTGSTRLVDAAVQEFVERNNFNVVAHSSRLLKKSAAQNGFLPAQPVAFGFKVFGADDIPA